MLHNEMGYTYHGLISTIAPGMPEFFKRLNCIKYEHTQTPVTVRNISNLVPSMNEVLWSVLEAVVQK